MIFRQLFQQWKAFLAFSCGNMMEENLQGICEMGKVAIIEMIMLIIVDSILRGLRPFPNTESFYFSVT